MKNDLSAVTLIAKFKIKIIVQPADIDELNHVNNVVYLRWVQQVAEMHWQALSTLEIRRKYLWVALRHEIDYLNPAFLGNEITVYTWVTAAEGVKSIRHVACYRDDQCLANAKTTWCLIDPATQKPKRIGPDIQVLLDM